MLGVMDGVVEWSQSFAVLEFESLLLLFVLFLAKLFELFIREDGKIILHREKNGTSNKKIFTSATR